MEMEETLEVEGANVIYEEELEEEGLRELKLQDLDPAPAKLSNELTGVQDPLEEVNLGSLEELWITYISSLLRKYLK